MASYFKDKKSLVYYTPEPATFGTPASKDAYFGGVNEFSPNKNEYEYVEDNQLDNTNIEIQRYWKTLKRYGGTLSGNLMIPTFINYLIGDTSYTVSGAGPYVHTLIPQNDMLPSFSVSKVMYGNGGGSNDYTTEFKGCNVDTGTFEVKQKEPIKYSYDWIGKSRVATNSAVAPVYSSGANKEPFQKYALVSKSDLDATAATASYYMWHEATLAHKSTGGTYRLISSASTTNIPFVELTLTCATNLYAEPECNAVDVPEITQPVPQKRTYEIRVKVKLQDVDANWIAAADQANEFLSNDLTLTFQHSANDKIVWNFSKVSVFAPDPPINVTNDLVLLEYTLRPAALDSVVITSDINQEFYSDPDTA